jgi:hypothetical protein
MAGSLERAQEIIHDAVPATAGDPAAGKLRRAFGLVADSEVTHPDRALATAGGAG